TNGGSASGTGVDFGLTAHPLDRLELRIDFSWNNLQFDSNVISSGQVLFAEGQRPNLSAKETAGLSVNYKFPLAAFYEGQLSASANYTSPLCGTGILSNNMPSTECANYMAIVRASFSIRTREHWEVNIFADNATNWNGFVTANPAFNQTPNSVTYTRVRPR